MAIPFICVCGKKLKAKSESGGKKVRCPACGALILIPVPLEGITVLGIDIREPQSRVKDSPEQQEADRKKGRQARTPFRIVIGFIGSIAALAFCIIILIPRHPGRDAEIEAASKRLGQHVAENRTPVARAGSESAITDDPVDERLLSLFRKASHAYAENPNKVVWMVKYMISEAGKKGVDLTVLEAIEGSLRWPMPGDFARPDYLHFRDYCAMYLTFRLEEGGKSHEETIHSLHNLASLFHLKSKEPAADAAFGKVLLSASPGCQLAMVESHDLIPAYDPVAEYYGELADQVARIYGVQTTSVSATVSFAITRAQLAGVTTHPSDVLKGAMKWAILLKQQKKGDRPPRLADFVDLYFSIDVKGEKSHDDIMSALLAQAADGRGRTGAGSAAGSFSRP